MNFILLNLLVPFSFAAACGCHKVKQALQGDNSGRAEREREREINCSAIAAVPPPKSGIFSCAYPPPSPLAAGVSVTRKVATLAASRGVGVQGSRGAECCLRATQEET